MAKFCLMLVIVLAFSCAAHHEDIVATRAAQINAGDDTRVDNLKRAARYPWRDDGRCAVRESSGDWATLVERCYDALDLHRMRFVDHKRVCPLAQAGAISADEATRLVGICLLVQPELAAGAVIVVGLVVVAAAIVAELQKKLPCKCVCMGIDGRGKRHGPYRQKDTKNQFACEQLCSQEGYEGGGFCI